MAVLNPSRPFDTAAFITNASLAEFFYWAEPSGGATQVVFVDSFDGITERLVLNGTFSDFVDGVPTSGTITSLAYSITDGDAFTLARISMSVEEFRSYVESDDVLGLFSSIFSGNDKINGTTGADNLFGFDGDDRIVGGDGDDQMTGGLGNDIYFVQNAGDQAFEVAGEGTDTIVASFDYTLLDDFENLRLRDGVENGTGNAADNLVRGVGGANTLNGMAGDDDLYGGTGNDTLIGGAGIDRLYGEAGADTHTGGAGADFFIFQSAGDMGDRTAVSDIITDFSHAEGDRMNLRGVDANVNQGGDQNFTFIGTAAFSGTEGEARYFQTSSRTVVELDTDGDGIGDLFIRLDGQIDLVAGDFIL